MSGILRLRVPRDLRTMAQSDSQPKIAPSEEVPGLMVKVAPLTAEDIPNPDEIGGKRSEKQEVLGKPITPEDAAEVMSSEQAAGHDTGKGSVAARMQSAAAVNVKENVVPPVGISQPGIERNVLSGKAEKHVSAHQVAQGSKETATRP